MIYCISDIHGCFKEFMALLEKIQFDAKTDKLYILGDVIDRGDRSVECVQFAMRTKNVNLLMGNHELMLLKYYNKPKFFRMVDDWNYNGNKETKKQIRQLSKTDRESLFAYLRERPYYKTVQVNGKCYFLSHSGLNVDLPFSSQKPEDFVWRREDFYENTALKQYTCVFGHTPTFWLRRNLNCAVWFDEKHRDKICIDCGCVFGGALSAIRLDDGAVFYEKSAPERNTESPFRVFPYEN